ncbi:MAG: hypothetical protein HDR06_04505 [Lachnospiraceae bacterium]|nr:hypothetical protein [Lachnospiraceae bacterium]
MKTNQWIQDVQKITGCETPELLCVLAKIATEDNSRGLFARKCESKILECMEDVKLFLGEIRRSAQDFTLHDITHCINVIDFMGQMLADVRKLNPAEISFFIYSALLHDIGMVKLSEEDISLNDLREDHGDRSARFIRERVLVNNDGTPFSFGEYDYIYMEYLPLICASHMQEFSFVEKLPQSYILDGMEVDMSLCAILLRVADAMDLKRNRAPYQLYQLLINRSVSPDHWKKHMSISNCQVNEKGVCRVDGICHDESEHRCLYNHLDSIESEIEKVFKWKNGQHPRLRLSSHIVERNVNTQSYKMWHHSFSMDILKITNLFMGEQIYGDRKLGLREIIQNSIDACMVRAEMNENLGTKQDYTYKPEIYIILDTENNQVIIRDNGTGMNDYIIQNYFLNIGASYYSSKDFEKKNLKYSPSGYFGIGFLSSFMLSDDIYVRTAHWQEEVEYEFHFIKSDKYVTKTEKPKTFSGMEIRLNLNQFMQVFENYTNDSLANEYSSVNDKIADFLNHTFWNLEINQIDEKVILCSILMNSFLSYVKENIKYECNYNIDLSEYLKDIEGIIQLGSSDLFEIRKSLSNLSEKNPLDALKRGEISISNNIREIFPFIKHFYTFNNKIEAYKTIEIKDINYKYFKTLFLVPTEDSIINKEYAMTKTRKPGFLNILKEIEQNTLGSWNCLCLDVNDYSHSITYDLVVDEILYVDDDGILYFTDIFNSCIGYDPLYYLRIEGVNDYTLSNVNYGYCNYNETNRNKIMTETHFWLKHARIHISHFHHDLISFFYFEVKSITMRILNSLIIPDTARKSVVDSSAKILKKAISVCVYLWVYDQIKIYNNATKSTDYLRKLILKNWDDSVEELLKPEKKPI